MDSSRGCNASEAGGAARSTELVRHKQRDTGPIGKVMPTAVVQPAQPRRSAPTVHPCGGRNHP
ncbi:hypothetical protein Ahy_A07g031846 isoform B [Arachis hypogaea]|uniref:Uncharacterized protein n=1 Tax=Arachis hypogaea TaxID=3818 RepID=A0A445C570_ARAHY|nr:hypothetical protein Ahy_A07g031846 isoform B [Arachis hypogaea]